MYVIGCIYDQYIQQIMDQSGIMVANPTRGQLKKGEMLFPPIPVRAGEFGLARSRPAPRQSAHSLHSGWIWCVTPRRRPFIRQPPSEKSRDYQVTQTPTDGVHCRESTSTEPVLALNPCPGGINDFFNSSIVSCLLDASHQTFSRQRQQNSHNIFRYSNWV